jgi:uncharacterized protein
MPIIEAVAKRADFSPREGGGDDADALQRRLLDAMARHDHLAIAVSGGIDSMTLAFIAHRFLKRPVRMVHAVSPAVPATATLRIKDYAAREGWSLSLVDAGEFSDPSYRANPVNRCYFCKSNLYDRIRDLSEGPIASGTNLDDLADFRPGLKAAEERRVVHPFVEAEIRKAGIRALARFHGLTDISELPAQPCLSSRVETGIAIEARDLEFIDRVERAVRHEISELANVRCRLTREGVVLEIGNVDCEPRRLSEFTAEMCREAGRRFAGVRPYRQGSAFIKTLGPSDAKHN